MIRKWWLIVSFFTMGLSGCAREQVADLILTVAFPPQWNGSPTSNQPVPEKEKENPFLRDEPSSSFDELIARLAELGELHRSISEGQIKPDSVDVSSVVALVNRIQEAGEVLATESGRGESSCRTIRSAQLAAFSIGAKLAPEALSSARETFYQKHFHSESSAVDRAATSALHILNNFLAAKELSREVLPALQLHALSYPDCAMNPQLFSALSERLANENQPTAAAFVAQEGLRLCGHLPGVESLGVSTKK